MFAFGFALVPFYEKICEVTGLRDIDRADEVANTQVDTSRTVRVELDSNIRNLPWTFRPLRPSSTCIRAKCGRSSTRSSTDHRAVTGQAIPSYLPRNAAEYFRKLDCFCFTKQTLQPGERRRMPVVFVLDGELPADVHTITLSYTFFEVEGGSAGEQKGSAARGS
jgi:cytochrome c oxidase assembly protein subunit 11